MKLSGFIVLASGTVTIAALRDRAQGQKVTKKRSDFMVIFFNDVRDLTGPKLSPKCPRLVLC
tara:strand:- start:378 stop:563 length:186 start_codon:yes stop_codon:yes gene_type:complete